MAMVTSKLPFSRFVGLGPTFYWYAINVIIIRVILVLQLGLGINLNTYI